MESASTNGKIPIGVNYQKENDVNTVLGSQMAAKHVNIFHKQEGK